MFQVLLVVVALLPVVVALCVLRGVRPSDEDRMRRRWRIQRRQWLAMALFSLTFGAGNCLVLVVDGGVVKYMVLIVPSVVVGALFMYKAQSTLSLNEWA